MTIDKLTDGKTYLVRDDFVTESDGSSMFDTMLDIEYGVGDHSNVKTIEVKIMTVYSSK